MVSETSHNRYKTEPLKCWGRAKELRLQHYKDLATAREQGKLLITGCETLPALTAGLGETIYFGGECYGATVGADAAFSEECSQAVEARGFARDLCSYMRNYWGSMFLDRFYFGGSFPRPDLVFNMQVGCDSQSKWFQMVAEYMQVPIFTIEMPIIPGAEKDEHCISYLVSQMQDAIAWMERTTGRKYDDEKLIEAVGNQLEVASLWAETCLLNQNIPAPLDEKSIFSLYVIKLLMTCAEEAVEFYRMLRDEVKHRVARGIAAVAGERCRLFHDSQPPWHFLGIYRYMERYGAVTLGSHYSFFMFSGFDTLPNGTFVAANSPQRREEMLKGREEALRALAVHCLGQPMWQTRHFPDLKSQQMVAMVRQWHADAVIIHLNRGCEGLALGQMENRLALFKEGVPVMAYEGNMSDSREFEQTQVLDSIDAFMESLGLRRLED
jgi:benzoyl-CoA reductase subunit B